MLLAMRKWGELTGDFAFAAAHDELAHGIEDHRTTLFERAIHTPGQGLLCWRASGCRGGLRMSQANRAPDLSSALRAECWSRARISYEDAGPRRWSQTAKYGP